MNKDGLGYNRTEDEHRKIENCTQIFLLHRSKSRNNLVRSFSVKNHTDFKNLAPITFKVVPKIYEHFSHF